MPGIGNPVRSREAGCSPYARFQGWGQASDGHNVAISHPEGRGLRDAMTKALQDAKVDRMISIMSMPMPHQLLSAMHLK